MQLGTHKVEYGSVAPCRGGVGDPDLRHATVIHGVVLGEGTARRLHQVLTSGRTSGPEVHLGAVS